MNASTHCNRIKKVANDINVHTVIFSLRYLWYVDLDGIDALKDIVDALESQNKRVLFSGVVRGIVNEELERHPFFQEKKSHFFDTTTEAINKVCEDPKDWINIENDAPKKSV